MKPILLLAWRYIAFNKLKTTILVACVSITLILPLTIHLLIHTYNRELTARARTTPLVLGAKGNQYDLILKTLYFRKGKLSPVAAAEVETIQSSGLGMPVPVHAKFTARKFPVIGTSLEYFNFRGLRVREGRLPGMLGQAVIGSMVAEKLRLAPGDTILSDQQNLYDLASAYPLKMHVSGVLAESGSPDDFAVFVDVKTAWVIEGVGHGHTDIVDKSDPLYTLKRGDDNVVATAALPEYNEITKDNISSFHFHGDMNEFPLTCIIVLPHDTKSATLIKARYNASRIYRIFTPQDVIGELMGIVFKVKRFFDANFTMIAFSTALFLILVVLLSLRIRRDERDTMHKLGCSRTIVFWLQAAELLIILTISLVFTGVFCGMLLLLVPELFQIV